MEESASYGSSPQMMAGRITTGTIDVMNTAAGNSAGAMTGFMGMGMAGGMMGGGGAFGAAQNLYNMGQQQPAPAAPAPAAPAGWTCSCGAVNKGKFCAECGKPKPAGVPQYKCDKCGWEPSDPAHPPKFCPECDQGEHDL
uniref:Rubredoxin-like domain-containing protein n=1 Tax=uncultured prokaryote TaxID=198431 RepID=A0A0H5Q387_9ZZZZ|nr:hypothetical protein [uncultured prokaryote]